MEKLTEKDLIKRGEYAGLTLKECIKDCGRSSVGRVYKYYDIEDKFLKKNHFHIVQDEDKIKKEDFFENLYNEEMGIEEDGTNDTTGIMNEDECPCDSDFDEEIPVEEAGKTPKRKKKFYEDPDSVLYDPEDYRDDYNDDLEDPDEPYLEDDRY